MKVATLKFDDADAARAFKLALRYRMYDAGYQPGYVTDQFRAWFPSRTLGGCIFGNDDAERAADVANEVSGVSCKIERSA